MKGDLCSTKGCGKKAIGYQSNFHSGLNVCEDHCLQQLLRMNSGEKKTVNQWSMHRY